MFTYVESKIKGKCTQYKANCDLRFEVRTDLIERDFNRDTQDFKNISL